MMLTLAFSSIVEGAAYQEERGGVQKWMHSSMVEHSAYIRAVPGSNPGASTSVFTQSDD